MLGRQLSSPFTQERSQPNLLLILFLPLTYNRGAVLSKLPEAAIITSSSATRHYGVRIRYTYDHSVDYGQITHVDHYTGKQQASRASGIFQICLLELTSLQQMKWYIKVGDTLRRDQKIEFHVTRSIPYRYRPDHLIFTHDLFECEDE